MKSGGILMRGEFNKKLLEILACPLSKEPLRYDIPSASNEALLEACVR